MTAQAPAYNISRMDDCPMNVDLKAIRVSSSLMRQSNILNVNKCPAKIDTATIEYLQEKDELYVQRKTKVIADWYFSAIEFRSLQFDPFGSFTKILRDTIVRDMDGMELDFLQKWENNKS